MTSSTAEPRLFSAIAPVARGDAEQVGATRNVFALVFVHHSVSQHDFPEHLNGALPASLVELAAENARKAVEIDGIPSALAAGS